MSVNVAAYMQSGGKKEENYLQRLCKKTIIFFWLKIKGKGDVRTFLFFPPLDSITL